MDSFDFHPQISRRRWLTLLAGFIFLILGVSLAALYVVTADQKSSAFLEKWEAQLGFKIQISKQTLGLGSMTFEGISFGPNYRTTISDITARVDMNPFSSRFGKLQSVHIGNLRSIINKSSLQSMLAEPKNQLQNPENVDPDLSLLKGILSPERLPADFVFEHGQITVLDESGVPLVQFMGLQAHYFKQSGALKFKVSKVNYQDNLLSRQIEGQLIMENNGNFVPFLVSGKAGDTNKSWDAKGQLSRDLSSLKLFTKNRGLPSSLIPNLEKIIPNQDTISYAVNLNIKRQKEHIGILAHLGTSNLQLKNKVLAGDEVLGPIPLRIKIAAEYNLKTDNLNIHDGMVALYQKKSDGLSKDPVLMNFTIIKDKLRTDKNQPWQIGMELNQTPCQTLISHSPIGFTPKLSSFQLSGSYSFTADFQVVQNHLPDFQFQVKQSSFDCQVLAAEREFSRTRLLSRVPVYPKSRAADSHGIPGEDAVTPYIPADQISPFVFKALVISEDGGFWSHNGFEFNSLVSALRRNLTDGKVSVGGSTISMQTVKNLFLTQNRTLSRKAQELFLTWYLENQLPKRKILEIYANIIEFGPGIWGIKHAANHFFKKEPSQLNAMESIYLASVLPSPGRRYQNFCQGYLSNEYKSLLIANLQKMLAFNMIDTQQYNAARKEGMQFQMGERDEQRCAIPVALGEVSALRMRR